MENMVKTYLIDQYGPYLTRIDLIMWVRSQPLFDGWFISWSKVKVYEEYLPFYH
jgi:hypothetical protein